MTYQNEVQEYIASNDATRVLIVDDSERVRTATREVLELANITVLEASDGKTALDMIYKHSPDLVLLDMVMPGMNGMSVLKTIRNSYTKVELPVILLSTAETSAEIVMAHDMGANDYVDKPLDFDVVWARVSNQLMQKQAAEFMCNAQSQLEQEVKQRTAELDKMNARLKREIEVRTLAQNKLKKQANYDQLTGLPNRNLAIDRLKQTLIKAARQKLRPCVAFVDLDNFKYVNDTLGHAAGDSLLQEAARRLLSCARKSDTVARLGGDEFLLILDDEGNDPDHEREMAISHVGDRLLETFARPFVLDGKEVKVSPSIGFAIYSKDGDDGETLMKNADASMYRSKKDGKNTYCFYSPEITVKAKARLRMESLLSKAIERREFRLLYQPVVDVNNLTITTAEALLRWHSAELGLVTPDVFIPIAEEAGLIDSIGDWVIAEACRQARCWRDKGWHDLCVAINISTRQIENNSGLVDTVRSALLANGLPSGALQFEVSEKILMNRSAAVYEVMSELSNMGIRLSLDDYGKGFSSIVQLQRYHFHSIKIDREFIASMLADEQDGHLVAATIAMANSLGISVVSKGVEDKAQLDYLIEVNCAYAQGYFYSKPVPAKKFSALLGSANNNRSDDSHLELVSIKEN